MIIFWIYVKVIYLAYDVNYFLKHDIKLNEEKIRIYLKETGKFGGNMNTYDLTNIMRGFNFSYNKKKIKIKLDPYGVDKFSQKKNMFDDFWIEISYVLV